MARELQASLLPPKLPPIAGADIASLYRPADAAVVGGDFFDVFVAGEQCVLAVGDVSGKGLAAAAVTGLARHTIRSAALWADGPAEILANLNHAMLLGHGASEDIERFCTVLLAFGRLTDEGLELRIASAGHPPALLADGRGGWAELIGSGPPAGWRADASYEELSTVLLPGERLLMYTDGLTEARTADGFLGAAGLASVMTSATSAQQTVAAIRRIMEGGDIEVSDDVAVLVVEATG